MFFLVCKALFGLLVFDLFGLRRDFARMHRVVSSWRVSRLNPPPETAENVCRAINFACVIYPRRVFCLQRSAVTTCLLRRCGIHARMIMGAQPVPFKAHAWTEINDRAVNEPHDVQTIYSVWERC